jgi:hypothetical protein
MKMTGIIGWVNHFKKDDPFPGPRKCDGEQPNGNNHAAVHHNDFAAVDNIQSPPPNEEEYDYPPIFARKP